MPAAQSATARPNLFDNFCRGRSKNRPAEKLLWCENCSFSKAIADFLLDSTYSLDQLEGERGAMKKDVIFSMRMNRDVRDILKKIAYKKRRTMSSLLDKIIVEYLEKEGFIDEHGTKVERRRHPRKKITLPARMALNGGSKAENFPSVILDLSKGGALLTYPKNSGLSIDLTEGLPQFSLSFELPMSRETVSFKCQARHMMDVGGEIHVGAAFKQQDLKDAERLSPYLM